MPSDPTPKRRLAEFWDRSRDYYAQAAAANAAASPERRLLIGYLKAGQRVLDLGCGSCENALWTAEEKSCASAWEGEPCDPPPPDPSLRSG